MQCGKNYPGSIELEPEPTAEPEAFPEPGQESKPKPGLVPEEAESTPGISRVLCPCGLYHDLARDSLELCEQCYEILGGIAPFVF